MRHPARQNRQHQTGQMGIIGALLGLVILGMVLGYAGYKFVQANGAARTQDAAQNVRTLIANAQQAYAHVPGGFAGVTAQVLINNGLVPDENVQGANIVTNFGTAVTVQPVFYYQPNDSIQLNFAVPAADCPDFAQEIDKSASIINVSGTQIKNTQAGLVATASNVATRCAAGGASVPFQIIAML